MTARVWQGLLLIVLAGLAGVLLALTSSGDEGGEERAIIATPTPAPAFDPVWVEIPKGQALEERHTYILDASSGTLWQPAGAPGLATDRVDIDFITWSPESKAVVTCSVDWTTGRYVTNNIAAPAQPFELFRSAATATVARVLWSPDGHFIATAETTEGQSGAHLEVRSLRAEPQGSGLVAAGFPNSWSADGRFLMLINAPSGGMSIWDSVTGERISGATSESAWSHQGARLAYIPAPTGWSDQPQTTEVRVRDFIAGTDERVATIPASGALSWSPDDTLLALAYVDPGASHQQRTLVIEADAGAPRFVISSSQSVQWSPADNTLAFAGNICGGMDIFTVDADTPEPRLRSHTEPDDIDVMPLWAPQGDRLAFVSVNRGLMEIAMPEGTLRELVPRSPDTSIGPLGWSPDGRYLAFEVGGGTGYCEGAEPETTDLEVLE